MLPPPVRGILYFRPNAVPTSRLQKPNPPQVMIRANRRHGKQPDRIKPGGAPRSPCIRAPNMLAASPRVRRGAPTPRRFARGIADGGAALRRGLCLSVLLAAGFRSRTRLAAAMHEACARPCRCAGCSTAGEITPAGIGEGQALPILLPREAFHRRLRHDRQHRTSAAWTPLPRSRAAEARTLADKTARQTWPGPLRAVPDRRHVVCGGGDHRGDPLGAGRHSADRRLGRRRPEVRDDRRSSRWQGRRRTAPSSC